MSKQVIIGDTHGHDSWKRVLNQEKDFDRVIFMGDYYDSFGVPPMKQDENFLDICAYARMVIGLTRNPDKVVMLIGNHDFHYLPNTYARCSGYRPEFRAVFEESLKVNMGLLRMAFKDEHGTLYTHAGLTYTFAMAHGIVGDYDVSLNELFENHRYAFAYNTQDREGYGDHISQGPLWVRPRSLAKDKVACMQVVGHTPSEEILVKDNFFTVDAMPRQYLVCNDGKFEIKQLKL